MQRQRVCQGKKKSRFGQKLTRMEMCFEKLTDIMRQSQLTSDNGIKALVSFR